MTKKRSSLKTFLSGENGWDNVNRCLTNSRWLRDVVGDNLYESDAYYTENTSIHLWCTDVLDDGTAITYEALGR